MKKRRVYIYRILISLHADVFCVEHWDADVLILGVVLACFFLQISPFSRCTATEVC